MSLEALLADLGAEARREQEALLARAEAEAARIRSDAHQRRERARAEALHRVRAEEAASSAARLAEARSEARRLVLNARAQALARVRTALQQSIVANGVVDPAYATAAVEQLRHLRGRLSEAMTVRASPEFEPLLREPARSLGVVVNSDETLDPGFVAHTAHGAVTADATVPALLDLIWPRLAVRLVKEMDP